MDRPFQAYRGDEPFTFVCAAQDDGGVMYPELAAHGAGYGLRQMPVATADLVRASSQ